MIIEHPRTIKHFKSLLTQPHEHLNALLTGELGRSSEQLFVINTRLSVWASHLTDRDVVYCLWDHRIRFPESTAFPRVNQLLGANNFLRNIPGLEWFEILAEQSPPMYEFLLFNLDLFN